jgi:hypothetical protein
MADFAAATGMPPTMSAQQFAEFGIRPVAHRATLKPRDRISLFAHLVQYSTPYLGNDVENQ